MKLLLNKISGEVAVMEPLGTPLFSSSGGVNMDHPGFPPAPVQAEIVIQKPASQEPTIQDLQIPAKTCLILESRLRKLLRYEKVGRKHGKQRKLTNKDKEAIEEELQFLSYDQTKFAQAVVAFTRQALVAPPIEANAVFPQTGEVSVPVPEEKGKEEAAEVK